MAIADVSGKTLQELISLDGRVAVVTGGARGIGFAICKRLAEAGAKVLVADLSEDAAKTAADRVCEQGGQAVGVVTDATDSQALADLADRAMSEYGRLDIWVNNAGIFPFQEALRMTDEQWSRVMDLNLSGTFYGSRAAATRMREVGSAGVIINLASTAAYEAMGPAQCHYVASKYGVRGLTKSLAVEFGKYGIRVLALAPTLIATEGVDEAQADLRRLTGSENPHRIFSEMLPLGRVGVPDDVARVALFCASDLSMLMTGDTLLIDAGNPAL